ncbi:MAG: hypothetical protein Q8K60_00310 [Parachlamydiaceae bacterium]|nr:hypothetical protein [Parachlamydiaceae bacterium]
MLVPDPRGFFSQINTDYQYLRDSVFGTNQVDNESNLNENASSEEVKKRKFDKIEFANTCFRLVTVGIMAYSIYWYVNTIIKLIKFPLVIAAHLLAFEGYVFSKAYSFKKISISEHKNSRVNFWETLFKDILQDSRLYFIKSIFNRFFPNNNSNNVKSIEDSDRIQEIPTVDDVVKIIQRQFNKDDIKKIQDALEEQLKV